MKDVNPINAYVLKLDPSKHYVIMFDNKTLDIEDVLQLSKALDKARISVTAVLINGNPKDVKVVEGTPG